MKYPITTMYTEWSQLTHRFSNVKLYTDTIKDPQNHHFLTLNHYD